MCVGTSCSQQFYTERGRGAWERSGPPSSGIEIIKRSCDSGVSITAHAGPENQAKSPYLLQTHTHTKERTDFCIFVRSWFISSSSELSSLTFLNYIQFLSRFGSVMTLWARDSEGRRASAGDSVCESLTYPSLAKIITPLFWGWSHGTGCFFLVNLVPFLTDWIPYLSFVFSV